MLSRAPATANASASQPLFLDGNLVGSSKGIVNRQGATLKMGFITSWPGPPGSWVGFNRNLASVGFYSRPLDQTPGAAALPGRCGDADQQFPGHVPCRDCAGPRDPASSTGVDSAAGYGSSTATFTSRRR